MSVTRLTSETYIKSIDELLDAFLVTCKVFCLRCHSGRKRNAWLYECKRLKGVGMLYLTEVGCFGGVSELRLE